jgi:hypothetical protein
MLLEIIARPFLVRERHPFDQVEVHVNGSGTTKVKQRDGRQQLG